MSLVQSPKGVLRMWQLAIVTFVVGILAFHLDHSMVIGWGTQALIQFSKAAAANCFLYYVYRLVLHSRTHEIFNDEQRFKRQNALVIAHAFVTGCVLAAG